MESKLSFDEVELNYILEAVQHFREHGSIAGTDMAVYSAELDNIEERIFDFLNSSQGWAAFETKK